MWKWRARFVISNLSADDKQSKGQQTSQVCALVNRIMIKTSKYDIIRDTKVAWFHVNDSGSVNNRDLRVPTNTDISNWGWDKRSKCTPPKTLNPIKRKRVKRLTRRSTLERTRSEVTVPHRMPIVNKNRSNLKPIFSLDGWTSYLPEAESKTQTQTQRLQLQRLFELPTQNESCYGKGWRLHISGPSHSTAAQMVNRASLTLQRYQYTWLPASGF